VIVGHDLILRIRKAETLDDAYVEFGGMRPKRRHHCALYEDVKVLFGAPDAHRATRERRGKKGVKISGDNPRRRGGPWLQLARIFLVD